MSLPAGLSRGLLLALLVTAALRLPAFRYGVISDDEAIYDAMAHVVASGGVMYRDTVDHKPPGLTFTYAAARLLAGGGPGAGARSMALVHLLGLLFVCGTALSLSALARRLVDDAEGRDVGAFAAALYGVASATRQPADGLAVNGELMMNLPLALGALAAVSASRQAGGRRALLDVAAGVLCALATLYKWQAALLGLALPLLLLDEERAVRARAAVVRGLCWLLGFASVIALAAAAFARAGVLDDAIFWGVRFNREYLAQGPGLRFTLGRLGMQLGGVVLPSILLYAAGLRGLLRRLRDLAGTDGEAASGRRAFLVAWTALSLLAVTLGGRFFGHYFLHAELPLCLLAAPGVAALRARAPRRVVALWAAPALAFAVIAAVPAWCRALFHGDDPDYDAIGRAAASRLGPDDTLWVWGNVPQIYHAADRRQGVRFSFCNYLTGLSPATPSEYDPTFDPRRDRVAGALEMALADLGANRPALVIDTAEHDLKRYGRFPVTAFPPLHAWLAAHYRRDETVAGAVLYLRTEPAGATHPASRPRPRASSPTPGSVL